jgi:hypothetical protein
MKDEDDDLRELNELLQQYAEAAAEERKNLLRGVERAISKVLPSLMDTADTRFFNGDYLKDMFDQCTKRALARPDLSPDRKTNAREDWDDFMAFFNAAKQWQVPKLAAHAFEMTRLGIFAGLRAGLSPLEVDELHAKFTTEDQQTRGTQSGDRRRDKPWREFARNEALRMHNANRALTLSDITRIIEKEWESEKFEKVGFQQLFKYLSDQVDKGELPSSMKRHLSGNRRHGQ